jgi:hypothetical protein
MPRVCSRECCGKRLLTKDGLPDYRRHFCGADCARTDRREKMRAKRAQLKSGRCPLCGSRKIRTVLSDGCVSPHKVSGRSESTGSRCGGPVENLGVPETPGRAERDAASKAHRGGPPAGMARDGY